MAVTNDAGEILLIRRTDNDNWALPGGAVDLGESLTQAGVRETKEETGIDCEITGLSGIYTDPGHVILYTSNGEVRQEFSIVLTARATGGQPTPSAETSEVRWVALDDARRTSDGSLDAVARSALRRAPRPALSRLGRRGQDPEPARRSAWRGVSDVGKLAETHATAAGELRCGPCDGAADADGRAVAGVDVARGAARPACAGRPGRWSCRSRSARRPGRGGRARTPGPARRRGRARLLR